MAHEIQQATHGDAELRRLLFYAPRRACSAKTLAPRINTSARRRNASPVLRRCALWPPRWQRCVGLSFSTERSMRRRGCIISRKTTSPKEKSLRKIHQRHYSHLTMNQRILLERNKESSCSKYYEFEGTGGRGLAPGNGIAPNCCIIASLSGSTQSSVNLPSANREIATPSQ